MSFQLSNEHDQTLSIMLSNRAWYHLLELAEQHGWNPMGTIRPEWLVGFGSAGSGELEMDVFRQGSYTSQASRQVMVEDALNFAEALDRAFLVLEPRPTLLYRGIYQTDWDENGVTPGIGVITAVIELCTQGAFWIDAY